MAKMVQCHVKPEHHSSYCSCGSAKRLEEEKLSRIESAEKSAKETREDLENNSDKLDKILREKHGLTKI